MKKIIIGYIVSLMIIWILYIVFCRYVNYALFKAPNMDVVAKLQRYFVYVQCYAFPILFFILDVYVLMYCLKENMAHQFKIFAGINIAFLVLNLALYYSGLLAPIVLQYSVLSVLEMFVGLLMVYSMKRRSLS